jgi:aconitate hydratase
MLRRHGVDGGVGRVIEYHGPGVANLSAMDRHVICNMGAELGATTSVFPADDEVRRFLTRQGREDDFTELVADEGASYDVTEQLDLSTIEPLIALPTSPGNVVPSGRWPASPSRRPTSARPPTPGTATSPSRPPSSTRPGRASATTSRSTSTRPAARSSGSSSATATCCRWCAPVPACTRPAATAASAWDRRPRPASISLRTTPRNFPGRSGTVDDEVHLCSPETAVASAITGVITDPRDLAEERGLTYPDVPSPTRR